MFLLKISNFICKNTNNLQFNLFANVHQCKFRKSTINVTHYYNRNIYYLSTNRERIFNDVNNTNNLFKEKGFKSVTRNNLLLGQCILRQSVTPTLGGQIQNIRNFSTEHNVESSYLKFSEQYRSIWSSIFNSDIINSTTESLISVQSATDLPWWSTIILSAVLYKTIISFPLNIYVQHLQIRLLSIQKYLQSIAEDTATDIRLQASRNEWTPKRAQFEFKQHMLGKYRRLYVKDNCHPMKVPLISFLQIFPWFIFSVSIRKCCSMSQPILNSPEQMEKFADLNVGGFAWISDLSLTDPYYILPVILLISNLTYCEMLNKTRDKNVKKQLIFKILHNAHRIMGVSSAVISAFIPSGVALFWSSVSLYTLGQHFALKNRTLLKLLKLPARNQGGKVDIFKRFSINDKSQNLVNIFGKNRVA